MTPHAIARWLPQTLNPTPPCLDIWSDLLQPNPQLKPAASFPKAPSRQIAAPEPSKDQSLRAGQSQEGCEGPEAH